jgi:hypothetical protein
MISETADRVPAHTPDYLNRRIWEKTRTNVMRHGREPRTIEERLQALNREWDIERILEANASTLVVLGTILGVFANPWFYLIPFLVGGFLLQHAIQGWCPPIRLFRRLGFRTHTEIASEYYALRCLKGDFRDMPSGEAMGDETIEKVLEQFRWS